MELEKSKINAYESVCRISYLIHRFEDASQACTEEINIIKELNDQLDKIVYGNIFQFIYNCMLTKKYANIQKEFKTHMFKSDVLICQLDNIMAKMLQEENYLKSLIK